MTLELARLFARAGHRVLMAESLPWHLSRLARAVAANFRVPPPRQDPAGFTRALAEIARREGVDLLVPTCEEIYTVARGRAELEAAGAGDWFSIRRLCAARGAARPGRCGSAAGRAEYTLCLYGREGGTRPGPDSERGIAVVGAAGGPGGLLAAGGGADALD